MKVMRKNDKSNEKGKEVKGSGSSNWFNSNQVDHPEAPKKRKRKRKKEEV